MALRRKSNNRWWSRIHFLLRFVGLLGLLCAGIGVALAFLYDVLDRVVQNDLRRAWEFARPILTGETGDLTTRIAVGFLLGGAACALLSFLIEVLVTLVWVTGRRSAFGLNAALQAALITVLLVGLNLFSSQHYYRWDWTRGRQFTLPSEIQSQLSQLKGETSIIVYQRHKSFGQMTDKPDAYDFAAERKVVEKVKDLVEEFREYGPQFKVTVLDVEEEGYNKKLAEAAQGSKELSEAIESAPENSIFFYANGKVQRLGFHEFYQLDKTASKKADHDRGNLTLLYQGVKPFADKVLNVDEKRPKIGILVIHEWLTTQGPEEYGLGGLKKSLTSRGFDVRDVVLKKWSEVAPPEPAVFTYEESKFETLEERLADLNSDIKNLEEEINNLTKLQEMWKTKSLDELSKEYAKQLEGRKINEAMRRRQLAFFAQNEAVLRAVLAQYREERDATAKEKDALNVDAASEQRRITDLKAKLERSIGDCDLLVVPRMTIMNLVMGSRISNRIHRLDDAQVAAVKEFIRSGKPILACFGPANEPAADIMQMQRVGPAGPDGLENLLSSLGIKFANQTVLFNAETKSFAERRSGLFTVGANVEVPAVEFEQLPEEARPLAQRPTTPAKPNPVLESMRIASHSRGDKGLELRVRHPRPIYYEPGKGASLDYQPEIMLAPAASWNEDQPFPSREKTPRYEPAKPDDPSKGTVDEKRRGPFPIGVAVETRVPADWYTDKSATPATVRVAAIGHGGLFTGPDLSPAKEELLLNTCNWLLGRDDLLPREDQVWSYPRVALDPKAHTVWHYGAWLGLPGVIAVLGLIVLMVRHLR
jgi:hypothetical protein